MDTEWVGRLAPFLRPVLRLFLSVDLVGSTALKQQAFEDSAAAEVPRSALSQHGPRWFSPIANFFLDFERNFRAAWADLHKCVRETRNQDVGPAPEFWKAAGDELLFVKQLTEPEQANATLSCFLHTLMSYNAKLEAEHRAIRVKGAAWLAGFPVANTEMIFQLRPDPGLDDLVEERQEFVFHHLLLEQWYTAGGDRRSQLLRDFVGPSIDTGFRLTGHAGARRLVVSVDLALMLSTGHTAMTQVYRRFATPSYFFGGLFPIKGVMGGAPYPIIWLDASLGGQLEDWEKLHGLCGPRQIQHVHDYCEAYIAAHSQWLGRPFIIGSTGDFVTKPPGYRDKLEARNRAWVSERALLDKRRHSTIGPVVVRPDARGATDQAIRDFAEDVPETGPATPDPPPPPPAPDPP